MRWFLAGMVVSLYHCDYRWIKECMCLGQGGRDAIPVMVDRGRYGVG